MDDLYDRKRKCLLENGTTIYRDDHPWVQSCVDWVTSVLDIRLFAKTFSQSTSFGYNPINTNFDEEYQDFYVIGKTPFDVYMENMKVEK